MHRNFFLKGHIQVSVKKQAFSIQSNMNKDGRIFKQLPCSPKQNCVLLFECTACWCVILAFWVACSFVRHTTIERKRNWYIRSIKCVVIHDAYMPHTHAARFAVNLGWIVDNIISTLSNKRLWTIAIFNGQLNVIKLPIDNGLTP